MKPRPENSTAEGQTRMFWQAHDSVAADMHSRMAEISHSAGLKDAQEGKDPQTPRNADYMRGYEEGKPTK